MKEKLLLAAASLLGFATACENKRTVDMYGTPYFDYKVKGKVTDKEGAPVKGIEVGSQDAGPVTSGSDGSYELSGREWSFRQTTLTFTDIDGPGKRRRIYRKESDRGIYRGRPHGEGRGLVRRHLLPLGRRCGARKEGISARSAFRNRKYAPAEPDRICIASDFSHIHRIQVASRAMLKQVLALHSTFTIFGPVDILDNDINS